jgi:hypothetical protein
VRLRCARGDENRAGRELGAHFAHRRSISLQPRNAIDENRPPRRACIAGIRRLDDEHRGVLLEPRDDPSHRGAVLWRDANGDGHRAIAMREVSRDIVHAHDDRRRGLDRASTEIDAPSRIGERCLLGHRPDLDHPHAESRKGRQGVAVRIDQRTERDRALQLQ